MAEKGAHLTSSVLTRPSIFELIAQESLAKTIHPAVKKLCDVLAESNPGKYGFLLRWFEELYVVAEFLLQRQYLNTKGSSFSEAFYGLQRVVSHSTNAELPKRKLQLSLICLTVLPYLRRKLENIAVKYKLEEADGVPENNNYPKGTRSFVIRLHSVFHIVWESLVLVQYFMYMSGKSLHHSPLLRMIGISLIYTSQEPEGLPWSYLKNCITSRDFRSLPGVTFQVLRGLLSNSFEVFAFFLQFLQVWYSEQRQTNLTALPIPAAPTDLGVNDYKNVCPICLQKRKIPTVLPVSGYIFCYRCIADYVRKNHSCPITRYPASDDDFVRIY